MDNPLWAPLVCIMYSVDHWFVKQLSNKAPCFNDVLVASWIWGRERLAIQLTEEIWVSKRRFHQSTVCTQLTNITQQLTVPHRFETLSYSCHLRLFMFWKRNARCFIILQCFTFLANAYALISKTKKFENLQVLQEWPTVVAYSISWCTISLKSWDYFGRV